MRSVLLSAGLGLTICASLAVPAGAARSDDTEHRPATSEPAPVQVDRPNRAATDVRPIDVVPDETIRLACEGRINDAGGASIGCTWSESTHRAAAGYRLVRSHGDTRSTVFTTRDLTQTSAVDTHVRLDVAYTYVVLVVDANGETVGSGGPVHTGVRSPDADIDVITFECTSATDAIGVRCDWRPTSAEDAIGYQLWRIVNRGERVQVWRGGLDQISARDILPDGTLVARYAVLAVDAEGTVVGQSRPVTLHFRDGVDVTGHRSATQHRLTHLQSYR